MTPAAPEHPQDPVGVATEAARYLSWRVLFSLLGWDVHVRLGEAAAGEFQRARARDAWPQLVRAMDALAEAAPFSAEDGAALDARMQDWLDAAPGRRSDTAFGDNPITGAASLAGCVSAHLLAANAPGATRRDRVEALTRAFRAWPSCCRAVARMSERFDFSPVRTPVQPITEAA